MTVPKPLRLLIQGAVILLVTSGLLEVTLRVFPGLIPPFLLVDFNPAAREMVAERRGLPTDHSVLHPPRDDGGPPEKLRVFRPFAKVSWDLREPGFATPVVMDPAGFCNPPGPAAGPGRVDFIALGDSFTFCLGVRPEEAWPARLASLLGVPGANLGAPGIGLYEHLQVLKQFGLARSPRLVILNLYEGNDLRDAAGYEEYRGAVGEGRQAPARKFVKDRPLGRNSFAYNLIVVGARHVNHALRGALFQGAGISDGGEPVPDFHYRLRFPRRTVPFNGGNVDTDEVRSARELRGGSIHLDCFREGLERFAALSRERGFLPVVAYTPSAYTAYAGFVEFSDPALAELLPWFSRTQRDFFRQEGERLGLAFLDLTPALQEAGRSLQDRELLYFPGVLHLTRRGHAVVAEALASFLRSAAADDRMRDSAAGAQLQSRRMGTP